VNTLQIGLIASAGQTSGSDRYYFDLLRALRAHDVGARGVVLGNPHDLNPAPEGVVGFAPEGSGVLTRWRGLRRAVAPLLRESDLAVSHFAPHAFAVLDRIRKLPLVVHFHGPWALEGRAAGLRGRTIALREFEERAVYARAARIVVLSRAFGAILTRHYGVSPERIRVVPGGVDLERFSPGDRARARAALGLPADRPLIACVRRLAPTKGVERLIAALPALRARVPGALVAIAGTGSLAAALRAQARDLGVEEHVRFLGFLRDEQIPELYRAADLSVVPSVAFEGFGLVVLEALACGTPVVATPVDGLREALEAFPASLAASSEPADIARRVADALDGTIASPSPAACRAYAERFAWGEIARRVRDVYLEAA
jgi:glycosyltransferase involved in cell wall biosynthesis